MDNLKRQKKVVKKPLSERELGRIKDLANGAFSNIGTENYRQKLAYTLLNTVKADNQKEFFWTLLRPLNAQKDNDKTKDLVGELMAVYPLGSKDFEKVAYSVIMGIMSAKTESGGE